MKLTKIPDNCGRAKHAISYDDKTVMSRFWYPFPENHPYVNKEVCVNIELFLLVFVHEKSPRRAFAARE